MRVWLNEWVLGSFVKVLEMEDDRVVYENELGRAIRESKGIKTAADLWEMYGNRFNPYLIADMSREDYEKYEAEKNRSSKRVGSVA